METEQRPQQHGHKLTAWGRQELGETGSTSPKGLPREPALRHLDSRPLPGTGGIKVSGGTRSGRPWELFLRWVIVAPGSTITGRNPRRTDRQGWGPRALPGLTFQTLPDRGRLPLPAQSHRHRHRCAGRPRPRKFRSVGNCIISQCRF